jgi:hypothetical protein
MIEPIAETGTKPATSKKTVSRMVFSYKDCGKPLPVYCRLFAKFEFPTITNAKVFTLTRSYTILTP